jgi:hypothetical protein
MKLLKKAILPQILQITYFLFAEISFPVPGSASNFVAVN